MVYHDGNQRPKLHPRVVTSQKYFLTFCICLLISFNLSTIPPCHIQLFAELSFYNILCLSLILCIPELSKKTPEMLLYLLLLLILNNSIKYNLLIFLYPSCVTI